MINLIKSLVKRFKRRHLKLIKKGDPPVKTDNEKEEKSLPKPHDGIGSGMGYVVGEDLLWYDSKTGLYHDHNLKFQCNQDCPGYRDNNIVVCLDKPIVEELKGHKLMIRYLEYVLQNTNDKRIYDKTDEDVAESLGISRQKAQRIKQACINEDFLIRDFRRKRQMDVNINMIQEHIKVTSV